MPSVSASPGERFGYARQPYRRGYTLPSNLRPHIAEAHRTRLWRTTATALADHAVCLAAVLATAWSVTRIPWYAAMVALVLCAGVVGRQLRALECLVHEASHYNWSRRRRLLNDVLAMVLVSAPTGAPIGEYRTAHLLHHGRFGTSDDPDRVRYVELGVEELRRARLGTFARDLVRRLPRYQIGWLRSLRTSPFGVVVPLCWPLLTVGPAVYLALDGPGAVVAVGAWLAGYLLALPVIRLVAESEEHVYSGATTVFDATFTNIGRWQAVMFHPHNDGYHTVHHLWPGIPHHALRRVHDLLVREDAEGFGRRVLLRTEVLSPMPRRT